MTFKSLDTIVKSILLQRGKPIHYYYRWLKYSADCFRELNYDTLKIIHTEKIAVNTDTNSITLPSGFVDLVKVGLPLGQFVQPLSNNHRINRLPALDDDDNETLYGSTGSGNGSSGYNVNDHFESTGREFNWISSENDSYKLIKERNIIQLSEGLSAEYIILEYIGDGTHTNAATQVDAYAQKTIEAYIDWQSSPNFANEYSPEGQRFKSEERKLRARVGDYTLDDIKRVLNRYNNAAIKN